jgi:hypothetical protein
MFGSVFEIEIFVGKPAASKSINRMCHVPTNIYQQVSTDFVGILAIPCNSEIHSLLIREFLAVVALEENNRHELDFLLRSFARYTIITTISCCCAFSFYFYFNCYCRSPCSFPMFIEFPWWF